jgi:hypothetical protein
LWNAAHLRHQKKGITRRDPCAKSGSFGQSVLRDHIVERDHQPHHRSEPRMEIGWMRGRLRRHVQRHEGQLRQVAGSLLDQRDLVHEAEVVHRMDALVDQRCPVAQPQRRVRALGLDRIAVHIVRGRVRIRPGRDRDPPARDGRVNLAESLGPDRRLADAELEASQ